MIRIDEIYSNTFLPLIAKKHNHAMHWFDPFGSTKLQDLCSAPAINNMNNDAIRYLFWDQEPLYKKELDCILPEFNSVYDGKLVLVTSEMDSEAVEYANNKYGAHHLYYFFHGWAALDWFRGYDKTFLIDPPQQRQIKKTFIAPNRIIAGERQHRLEMLYYIFKNRMWDNHISCPLTCPAENINIYDAVQVLADKYPDIEQVMISAPLPMQFKHEENHPMHSCWLSLFDESAESLLYLVTETVATGQRLHLTEKTFKPIALGMPFIIVGTKGSLEYLRSYGFKTFDSIWDESYDLADDNVRIERIASLLTSLNELSDSGKQDLFEMALPIIEHNYNHFYNGGFEKILWSELQDVITTIQDGGI